jgi:stress response protein SCP2
MTVRLEKGGRQSLGGLSKVKVCIGWDEVNISGKIVPKKGFLGKLQNMVEETAARMEAPDIDIDLICIVCNANGKRINTVSYAGKEDFANKISLDRDDRKGNSTAGGDDETIHVVLSDVRPEVDKLEFWCDIYDCIARNQHFGMIRNAFARVVDEATSTEICRLNLSEDYNNKRSIYIGSVYKKNGEWKFKAEGSAGTPINLRQIEAQYN